MKPYGREKKISSGTTSLGGSWKKDYHCHDRHHRKVGNWWEGICDFLTRSAIKRKVKKQIEEELTEQ